MRIYSKFIGLDVHKDSIAIAVADGGRTGEVRFYGTVAGSAAAVVKALAKIAPDKASVLIAYEAGPCGYTLYRHLTKLGYECQVVAPSLIPIKAGDKIKTDRRDSLTLAKLLRSGELTAVHIPAEDQERLRDLSRAREDLRRMQMTARQRLKAFLLRHGRTYEKKAWSKGHYTWIREQNMGDSLSQLVLEEYLATLDELDKRITRMTDELEKAGTASAFATQIAATQAMRGVSSLVATTVAAEIGDLTRFDHPTALMAFVGLVPSEHSSGNKVKRGSITKTGNQHVRRVLVEGAWAYRYQARVSRAVAARHKDLATPIKQIAWKAQVRLCKRYHRLTERGKTRQVVVTAIAREMIAYMWEIAQATKAAA